MWVRRQNQAARLRVLWSNWRSFAGFLITALVLITGIAFLIPQPFARGVFVGTSASFAICTVTYMILALSGTVATGMGATAEIWTASELRPLRKHGWTIINGVPLEGRDVDHVLVGPGGVIVVESKWSAGGWQTDPPDPHVRHAIEQASRNARSLRLWHGVKATGVPVRSAVLLWGGTRPGAPDRSREPVRLGDTSVAYGLHAIRSWVKATAASEPSVMGDADIDQVWRALDKIVRDRERVDNAAAPPLSLDRVVWTAVATMVVFVAAVLGSVELLVLSRSWWVWAAGSLTLLAACLVLRRWPLLRVPATGGVAGLAVGAVTASISGIVALLR